MQCTFAEFFDACKDKLTDIQLRALNGTAKYFKLCNGYVGCYVRGHEGKRQLWISSMVGDMRDIWLFRKELIEARIDEVHTNFRLGGPVERLAAYYKAEVTETGEFYADGCKILLVKFYPKQTKRLQKSKDKETAKA